MKSKKQIIEEIEVLEIEADRLKQLANGEIFGSPLFNKYLKLTRKLAKLRDKL